MRTNTFTIALYSVLVAFFVAGCAGRKPIRGIDSMENSPALTLSFEELKVEPLIGRPHQLEMKRGYLIVADDIDGKLLLLYNVEDSSYTRTLPMGQGPDEMLSPITLCTDSEDCLYVLERRTGICKGFSIDALIQDSVTAFSEVRLKLTDRIAKTKNGYIGAGYYDKGIICSFDNEGNISGYMDEYEKYNIKNPINEYHMFQGRIICHEQNGLIMFAPCYASTIWFYADNGNHLCKVDSFEIGKYELEERIRNKNEYELLDGDKHRCLDLCQSDKFFYMLYDGSTLKGDDNAEERYILRFACSGAFDKLYKVPPSVSCICVSNDDSRLYAIYQNEEAEYVLGTTSL